VPGGDALALGIGPATVLSPQGRATLGTQRQPIAIGGGLSKPEEAQAPETVVIAVPGPLTQLADSRYR
jgi:hypothetical protein